MNATHALGWALVHFLWQGAALAVLLGIARTVTRPAAARTRYTLSSLTLLAMLVLPIATGLRLYDATGASHPTVAVNDPAPSQAEPAATGKPQPSLPFSAAATARAETGTPTDVQIDRLAQIRALLDPALPWLVVVWAMGVILLSIRLAHGWLATRRLRTQGTSPTSASLQQMLERLAARLRVTRPVQLLESLLVEVPAVIGWLRPVILVPASALTGLTPQQLEVLLAHELAHVRRRP